MRCLGRNLAEHCCSFDGEDCRYLEENTVPGFRWSCGLRRELGSWDAVIEDARYKEHVQPGWDAAEKRTGIKANCRDWPSPGYTCGNCGAK